MELDKSITTLSIGLERTTSRLPSLDSRSIVRRSLARPPAVCSKDGDTGPRRPLAWGGHADVAQLAEAQALGACQCGFESRRRHEPHELVSIALAL